MDWNIDNTSSNHIIHSAVVAESTEYEIKAAVLASVDYAFSLLNESIEDDAMYCLFDWDDAQSTLTIVVTDQNKTNDGKHVVNVVLSNFEQPLEGDQAETVKFWVRDHLTTSSEFLAFSLIAGFTRGERTTVELM